MANGINDAGQVVTLKDSCASGKQLRHQRKRCRGTIRHEIRRKYGFMNGWTHHGLPCYSLLFLIPAFILMTAVIDTSYAGNEPPYQQAATSTRTVTPYPSPLDVRVFGAKGDGQNDDGEPIRRALASSAQFVLLPPGTYKISSTLIIPAGKWLSGSGTRSTTIRYTRDGGTAISLEGGEGGGSLSGFKLESGGRNQTGIFVAAVHPVLRNIEISGFENIGLRLGTAGVNGTYFAQIDNVFVYNRTRQGNIGILVDGSETLSSNANTFRNVFVKGRFTTFVNLKGNDNLWHAGDTEWDCTGRGVADVWLIEGVGNVVDGTYMESGNGVPDRVFRFTRNSSSNVVRDVYAAFVVNSIFSKSVDEGWGNELSFKPVSPNLSFPGENTGITNLIQNSHFRSWSGKSPTGWMINSGSFSRDSTNTRGGAYSLKAVASHDNPTIDCYIAGNRSFATGVPIDKFRGQMVTAGVLVKTGKAEKGNIKICADGIGGGGYGNNRHTGNNMWQFLTATLRVPNDATFLMVQLRGFGSGVGTGEAYFSEPILVEGIHLPHPTPAFLNDSFSRMSGAFVFNYPIVFPSGDTAPSVKEGNVFKTANTSATKITGFSHGYAGQRISVIYGDSNTSVGFKGTSLKGHQGVDWRPSKDDHMTCVYDGKYWYCDVSINVSR